MRSNALKLIVGVSDMKVSNNPNSELITYSLGSCIGVVIFDPFVKVGGILHYMLPESSIDREKAERNPYMFADSGIPLLFKETYKYNATKNRMRVAVFGGSQILDQKGFFNIGKRNYMAMKKILFKNNVLINKAIKKVSDDIESFNFNNRSELCNPNIRIQSEELKD